MTSAAQTYGAMVEAVNSQRDRLSGQVVEEDIWTGARAERFRSDPHREPEALLQVVMEYLRPDDVLLDVGGGAGRFGLALALHCRELVNVDPSGGMKRVFEDVAREAGIKNARYVESDWLAAKGIEGDLSLIANVTYFVADIAAFIEKLQAASRRRVLINVAAEPPPNGGADMFEAVYGEPLALLPGYRELLPALWEAGILPEVRLMGEVAGLTSRVETTREGVIESASSSASMPATDRERIVKELDTRFDELFVAVEGGFQRRRLPDARQLLITWETN